jgi:hypothetical protein
MSRILLDPEGALATPEGYRAVGTEAEFWQAALSGEPLHIKDHSLCGWAKEFYSGRGEEYREVRAPYRELREVCPALSVQQAQELCAQLGPALAGLPRTLQLDEIARELFKGDWWLEPPSVEHAALWIMWWHERTPSAAELVFLAALGQSYHSRFKGHERAAYEVSSSPEAEQFLHIWLGLVPSSNAFQPFPLELPNSIKQSLMNELRGRVLSDRAKAFSKLQLSQADAQALRLAAEASAEYYQHHPDELDLGDFRMLERFLTQASLSALRDILPVQVPGPIPETSEQLKHWFLTEYLPYRAWHRQDRTLVERCGIEFAQRYLRLYSDAINGGPDRLHLNWTKARELKNSKVVTLLVVLDGLGYLDMKDFWASLQDLDTGNRLALSQTDLAFAPIPSITEFAKPALVSGVSPLQAANHQSLVEIRKKDTDVSEALDSAQPGDLIIWSFPEPDCVYHDKNDLEVAREMAHGALRAVAKRVLAQVQRAPLALQLRVVVTTDHGRLLAASCRDVSVPQDFVPHGRAAAGNLRRPLPEQGYEINNNVVFVRGSSFSLDRDVAIVLSESSFRKQDGKGGVEAYPHGGLFPEEVLIPWWVALRDTHMQPIVASVFGKGVAGRDGTLTLQVNNPNPVIVNLGEISLSWLTSGMQSIGGAVGPMSSLTHQMTVHWPTGKEATEARSRLYYQLPDGSLHDVEADVAVTSEEMYTRDNPLEDLL